MHRCPSCETCPVWKSGLPGVLARVEGGEIRSDVERCDTCQRYPSDASAKVALERWLALRLRFDEIYFDVRIEELAGERI